MFGVHGVGGIFGALLTGVFNAPSLGGPGLVTDWVTVSMGYPGIGAQLLIQAKAVGLVVVWTGGRLVHRLLHREARRSACA